MFKEYDLKAVVTVTKNHEQTNIVLIPSTIKLTILLDLASLGISGYDNETSE
jgi:hypothetical protein